MGRPASKVTRVRVTGPLALFAPMLKARLRERGYTPLSTVIVRVAHVGAVAAQCGFDPGDAGRCGSADPAG